MTCQGSTLNCGRPPPAAVRARRWRTSRFHRRCGPAWCRSRRQGHISTRARRTTSSCTRRPQTARTYTTSPSTSPRARVKIPGASTGWSIENFSYDQQTINAPSGSSWNKRTSDVIMQVRISAAAAPSEPRNVTIVSGDDEVTLTWQVPSSWGDLARGWIQFRAVLATWPIGKAWDFSPVRPQTTHTIVRNIYRNVPGSPATASKVKVRLFAYSQRPGTDGSKDGHFTASKWVTTARVTVGGPMAAPTNLTVTPSARALGLSWTAPAQGTASALTGYDVHYTSAAKSTAGRRRASTSGRNPATAWVDANHTGTTASATIGSLAASTAHRVRVPRARTRTGAAPGCSAQAPPPAAWSALDHQRSATGSSNSAGRHRAGRSPGTTWRSPPLPRGPSRTTRPRRAPTTRRPGSPWTGGTEASPPSDLDETLLQADQRTGPTGYGSGGTPPPATASGRSARARRRFQPSRGRPDGKMLPKAVLRPLASVSATRSRRRAASIWRHCPAYRPP